MRRIAVLIGLAMALAGCQSAKPDPDVSAASRTLYEQIRDGKAEAVLAQLPAGANTPATIAAIAKLRTLVPPGQPRTSTIVAAPRAEGPLGRAEAVVIEYDYADRTARFETAFQQPKGKPAWNLRSFRLQVASHKALAANALTLGDRSLAQLGYLALAISSLLLMIAAAVKALRTPNLANRWLWVAFAFVGLFSFQMNWANGVLLIDWMSLRIIGFWITSGVSRYVASTVSATVPFGALLILAGLVARPPKP